MSEPGDSESNVTLAVARQQITVFCENIAQHTPLRGSFHVTGRQKRRRNANDISIESHGSNLKLFKEPEESRFWQRRTTLERQHVEFSFCPKVFFENPV